MRIPTGFSCNVSNPTCDVQPKTFAVSTLPAADCTYASGVITLKLPAVNGAFNQSVDSTIEVTTGLVAPTLAGNYIFDFITKSSTGNVLETGACTVTLTA
jgi:hypothetical protein